MHRLRAKWLGSDADDFTMITTDGQQMTVGDLFGALSGARNAAPVLGIEVDEVTVASDAADLVVVHFRETHQHEGRTTRRRTTAVLRRTRQDIRQRPPHETAVAG